MSWSLTAGSPPYSTGCSIYGDSLYDIALLEFWSPRYPALEAIDVGRRFDEYNSERGVEIDDCDSRKLACLIHIGLDRVVYHAHTGDMSSLRWVSERMQALLD
jgi:hypothetical protein